MPSEAAVGTHRLTIAPVVEGHGEVTALPVLLGRIARELGVYEHELKICPPNRISRSKLATPAGIVNAVEQGALRVPGDGGVLVLFDADDDCPIDLVNTLLASACDARKDKHVGLVVAKREFEAWYLASAESLAGKCGLPDDFSYPGDPEAKRDAKGVLSKAMMQASGHTYRETVDQQKLAKAFDMAMARERSPSFDKLWRQVESLCGVSQPSA
jgi:Domain of unknown function (DUF4276)